MVNFQDVKAAHERIRRAIIQTPIMTSLTINRLANCSIFFKCENFQRIGAFKFRGAYNALVQLSPKERTQGVIAHSSGNHAQAVALAAKMLNMKATIVMPSDSSPVKLAATREYGAEVILCKSTVEDRAKTTSDLIAKHNYILIHPYDDVRVIAGNGTVALELIEEVGALDYMFAPIGGGGLICGTAIATKALCPKAKIIGVEPANADDAYRSFKARKLLPSVNPNTIADGLRTSLSELTFRIIRSTVDDIITVTEAEIVNAMRLLWERMKIIVEPSGAVPLAGLLKMGNQLENQRVGIILSGGNVDLSEFFEKYPI
ncbi:MAG: threonine/serine dehydratase [Promethearchaeota archaeon]